MDGLFWSKIAAIQHSKKQESVIDGLHMVFFPNALHPSLILTGNPCEAQRK